MSSHTVPQLLFMQTSTRPSIGVGPLTSLTSPVVQPDRYTQSCEIKICQTSSRMCNNFNGKVFNKLMNSLFLARSVSVWMSNEQ